MRDTVSGLTLAARRYAGAFTWSHAAWWPALGGGVDRLVRRPVVVLGLAAAVALAAFVLATPRALQVLGGLLVTLGIGVAGPWLSLALLRGQITFGVARCRVGDRVGFDLALTRFGRLVRAKPDVAWHTACESDSETMSPRRRGRFPQPEAGPWLASDWPFGIATARRQLEAPRPLIVRPRTSTVRFPGGMVAARRLGRDAIAGLPGQAGDVLGVREYRSGDSVRSIHWTQTARRDEVVVCERPGTAAARVRILLGCSPGRGDEPGCKSDLQTASAARLDGAVGVASSLVESWSARGAELEVGWTTAAGAPCLFRPRDRQSLDDTLDALACLESVGCPGAPSAAATEAAGAGRATQQVVDLEIVLDVGPQPATDGSRHRAGRRLVIAFVPVVGSDVISLPAAADAAAALDRALAEIDHDPDATRG